MIGGGLIGIDHVSVRDGVARPACLGVAGVGRTFPQLQTGLITSAPVSWMESSELQIRENSMKGTKSIVLTIFALIFSAQGFTQDDELTVFQAGQPARAGEVNENFQILSDRISQSGSALQVTLGYNATEVVNRVRITDVRINGGPITGTVAPNSTVRIVLNGTIFHADSCPGCIYQVLVGFAGEPRAACIFSSVVGPQNNPTRFDDEFSIQAPSAPGVYYLTFDSDAEFNCTDSIGKQAPSSTDSARRFAVLTVR